jgi:peptide/nickel transport system substrate-binding protein
VRLDGPTHRYVGDVAILQEVARQLGEVGLRVQVEAQPKSEFFALLDRRATSFYRFGWSCSTGHAGDALEALMHTPSPDGVGFENVQNLSDSELDRLIEAAHGSPRLQERSSLLGRALARVAQLRPILPLVVQTESLALAREIDWEPPLDLALRLRDIGWSASPAP